MRWWNRFGVSVLFAALVAASYPIYAGFAQLPLGNGLAFAIYSLTTAAIYLLGIAVHPAAGVGAAIATFGIGVFAVLGGASASELALLTGLLIGVFRSGLLHPGRRAGACRFGRHFAREFLLIGAGLALALYLAQGALHPEAYGLWGFYLVQSGFFLLGGEAAACRDESSPRVRHDAFTQAVNRAREVLAANQGSTPRL